MSQGVPPLGASNKDGVGETSYFEAKCGNISKTVGDMSKLLLMTNRKLHMRFRLTLNCISSNFQGISRDFAGLGGNNS